MAHFNMIEWSDDYVIGIEIIDEQHKKFFRLAQHFMEDCLADEGDERIKSTLSALGHYSIKHFRTEEALMEKNGYPNLEVHKKMHVEFIEEYNKLDNLLKEGSHKEAVVNETLAFLMDWLVEHVVNADGNFAKHIKRKG
ncbi:hemerythrin family protein [bacterium]|nr:hemerythrin family protein [bacterium]